MRKTFVAISLITLSLAAAVIPSQAASKSKPFPVLIVEESGGFVPVEYNFSRLPRVVLYSDGRMFARSDIYTQQYPGPAVQTILTKQVGNSITLIQRAFNGTKLWNPKYNWGFPWIADVPNTDVTSQIAAGVAPTRVSVYALQFTGPGLTTSQIRERQLASKLLDDLQAFSNKYVMTKSLPTSWISDRWVYQVREAYPNELANTQKWFGPTITGPVSCSALSPTDTSKLIALLPKINQATQFEFANKLWTVTFRPLLPHESGCKALGYK